MGKKRDKQNDKRNQQGVVNTSCYVQVLGLGCDTADVAPSVLLFFDHMRLLFNVGEGFQRFCNQHKIRMSKLSGLFTTRMSMEALGGVPGMLLTMADIKGTRFLGDAASNGMTLYGPPGVNTLFNAMRTFINVRDLGFKVLEFGGAFWSPAPIVKNEHVSIQPVLLRRTFKQQQTDPQAAGDGDGDGDGPAAKRQRVDESGAASGEKTHTRLEDLRHNAVCYIIELADIPGKFHPDKAKDLGVPRGPLYGRLQREESITLADGTVIHPRDVMEEAAPGPLILLLDCPEACYLPALLGAAEWERFTAPDAPKKVSVMIHLAPHHVTCLPEYRKWMAKFAAAQHIMVCDPVCKSCVSLPDSTAIQVQLNTINPQVFPLPAPAKAATASPAESNGKDGEEDLKIVSGENLLKYHLRPLKRQGLDSADVKPRFDAAAVQQSVQSDHPGLLEAVRQALQASTAQPVPDVVRDASRTELEISFLGTGAAIPSKYRNVTGTYVHLFDKGGLMVDCGEGSLGQLHRRFGSQADDIVRGLQLVWISHIHADHHVGLPRLLNERKRLLGDDCPPLLVLGPRPLRRAMMVYGELEPMPFYFADCYNTVENPPLVVGKPFEVDPEAHKFISAAAARLGLKALRSFCVQHCAHSFGLTLESEAGWKVVFSGDTRPCANVVQAAQGATLLVHEATFDDELADEAQAKNHSTISEALRVAADSNAYRVALTHFSQRYPKLPILSNGNHSNVAVAFDLMSANLADLPVLPSLVPALQLLFKDEEDEAAAA